MTDPAIRPASEADLVAIKRIADGCKREIGFVSRGMLRNAMGRSELLVAICGGVESGQGESQFAPTYDGTDLPASPEVVLEQGEQRFAPTDNETILLTSPEIVGFVDYHRRRDEQITIYGIVVTAELRGQGIGRALVAALAAPPQPVRLALKCPTDNPANGFYAALGFQLIGVETPIRRRPLNLWALAGAQLAALGEAQR